MAVERTLSIIKPDAVAKNIIGEIYSRFERNGLKIVASRMLRLSQADAEGFYAVHRERPFFNDLVRFMISATVRFRLNPCLPVEQNAHASAHPTWLEIHSVPRLVSGM